MGGTYETITAHIVRDIEASAADYRMPWHRWGQDIGLPRNACTGRVYRGLNIVILASVAASAGYSTGNWATYRQWSQSGAAVRKGQHGTLVLLWKPIAPANGEEPQNHYDDSSRPFLLTRAFHVFNRDQVDDAPTLPVEVTSASRINQAEAFFNAVPATVRHGGDRAYYSPVKDEIQMPEFEQFRSAEGYYSVRSHELVHWTGAKNRLDRDLSGRFGTASYAMEEMVAELGAAFVMGRLGLSCFPRRDHAAYISSWLEVLKSDPRAIVSAASNAQAAVDFLVRQTEEAQADKKAISELRPKDSLQPNSLSASS